MTTLIQLTFLTFLTLNAWQLHAQQGAVPSGGDAQAATGSIAYSIGQILYVPFQGEAGRVNPGLQQPNLSAIVATDEPQELDGISVYPNPTQDQLFLETDNPGSSSRLSFQLFDVQGKLVLQDQMSQEKTFIQMNVYDDGIYILRIYDNDKKSISYKIVKTH